MRIEKWKTGNELLITFSEIIFPRSVKNLANMKRKKTDLNRVCFEVIRCWTTIKITGIKLDNKTE